MENTYLLKKQLEEEIRDRKASEAKLNAEIADLRRHNRQLSDSLKKATIPGFFSGEKTSIETLSFFYENVLDGIPAEITVYSPEKKFLYLNPVRIKDRTLRESMIGKTDLDYCKALQSPEIIAQNRRILFDSAVYDKEEKEWEEEWQLEDGSTEHYLRKIYPVFGDKGHLQMVVGYGINITQRVLMENELRTSEELYRRLVQEAKDYGIFMVDKNGLIATWNEGAYRITGYTEKEITGKYSSVFHPTGKYDGSFDPELTIAIDKGRFEEEDWRIKKDGTPFWASTIITPLYSFHRELAGFSMIMHDLTKHKHTEEILKEAHEKAESLSKAKQLFLANMSHEIRTPMNAIIGISRILSREKLSSKQQHFMNAILTSAQNLHTIIDDILDFSKMEAGQLNINPIGFNPRYLMEQQIALFTFRAEEKGILLRLKLDNELHPVLISDPVRINQVLSNLLGNALKFTEQGSIDISLLVLENKEHTQTVQLEVKDTGIGIDAEKLPHIFDVFYQVNDPEREQYSGTGLGLSITRQLVELMEGEVFAESLKNEGTRIGFTAELKKGDKQDLPRVAESVPSNRLLRDKKILLVEDNEINRLLVISVLQGWGMQVDAAENGKSGIEKLESGSYDIVLMDLRMPELNGIKAIRYIREQMKSDIPVIAMTANVINGDAEESIRAGMNDYIPKPFEENELFLKICTQLKIDIRNIKWEQSAYKQLPRNQKLYSTAKLTKFGRGDEAFIKHMMAVFVEHMTQTMNGLNEASAEKDIRKIKDIAHKAGPSIMNICSSELTALIHSIEQLGDNNIYEGMPELIVQFNQHIQPVIEQITHDEL